MMMIEAYSVNTLLKQDLIKYNRCKLSKLLKISRATLTKYEDDKTNKYHIITKVNGSFTFFAATGAKRLI